MSQPTALSSWRSRTSTVLPLAFLQSLAYGFIEIPSMFLFRELECERYAATLPPHIPEDDLCRSLPVQKAYSVDLALYLAISTITSIVVSGPYGRISDMKGRQVVMASAACLNGIGDFWLCLSGILVSNRNMHTNHLQVPYSFPSTNTHPVLIIVLRIHQGTWRQLLRRSSSSCCVYCRHLNNHGEIILSWSRFGHVLVCKRTSTSWRLYCSTRRSLCDLLRDSHGLLGHLFPLRCFHLEGNTNTQ